jgi:hypothetical protein
LVEEQESKKVEKDNIKLMCFALFKKTLFKILDVQFSSKIAFIS